MDIKKYTIEQIENMDGHVELVNGTIVIQNKTTPEHNDVIVEIVTALKHYISSNKGKCNVYAENVSLYVNELIDNDNEFYMPDVMVVCDRDKIDSKGVHVAPLFVVEVTSESTKENDYHQKLEIYKAIGVKEYWIVDLQLKVVNKYLLTEHYEQQTFIHPKTIDVSVYPGLSIDLSEFMV